MNWEAIGAIAEVIGAAGVIVTLVYLAHQIRDNTRQSRLSSIRAINASTDSAFEPIYIPENTRVWTRGLADPTSLTADEEELFHLLIARLIASFDATTYQYLQGGVPAEIYEGYARFFSAFIATPGGAAWYSRNRDLFSDQTKRSLDGGLEAAKV